MRKFIIQSKRTSGEVMLWTRARRRNPELDMWLKSYVSVDYSTWDKANKDLDAWNKFIGTPAGKTIKEKLEGVDAAITSLLEQGIFERSLFDEAIQNVVFAEERKAQAEREQQEQERKEREAQRQADEQAKQDANVLLYLSNRIAGMKKGIVTTDKKAPYDKNTVKVWNNFAGILCRFMELHPFTWEDIDKNLTDKFLKFMEDEGYMVKSINKYFVTFRAMVVAAYNDGKHENLRAIAPKSPVFGKKQVKESDKAAEIYLNDKELQALYEMQLDGLKSVVRDVFLVGCYTCQRYSDFSNIKSENFTTTVKGTKVVKLVQEKTDTEVTIPYLNDNLPTIAEKYGYDIPKISDVIINRYIKAILKELSESVPSLKEKEVTKLTMKERAKEAAGEEVFERNRHGEVVKCRYDLVSTHTARRSGITNLYLTQLFPISVMMKISGHKTEKTFLEYVKLSSDEIADMIDERVKAAKENDEI